MWDLIVSVPEHCLSFYFDSVCIVKSTSLRAFIGSFQHVEDMLQTY